MVKVWWNFLCSKNIYIKGKKNTNGRQKKTVTTVATMPHGTVGTIQKKKRKK